jgi:hypothetical protein
MLKSSIAPNPRPTVDADGGRKITLALQACPHDEFEVRPGLLAGGDPAGAGMSHYHREGKNFREKHACFR